ncbi:hypothetical protein JCM8202_000266 [Rhodotorula sphaerocarpa]
MAEGQSTPHLHLRSQDAPNSAHTLQRTTNDAQGAALDTDGDERMRSRGASPDAAPPPAVGIPIGRRIRPHALSDGTNADHDDAQMRQSSEEPSAQGNLAAGTAPSNSTSSAAATTMPTGATVQRNPSVRARDAFARLRIGSAASSSAPAASTAKTTTVAAATVAAPSPSRSNSIPSPSNVGASTSGSTPGSPTSAMSSSNVSVSAVPIASATSTATAQQPTGIPIGAALSRNPSLRSPAQNTSAAAGSASSITRASPAASFLSTFSPPSSVGNRSPSPPPVGPGAGGSTARMPAFGSVLLPPRGDQSGFRIVVPASDAGHGAGGGFEYEYVLGRELGRGGMGLVREATRRKLRGRERRQDTRMHGNESRYPQEMTEDEGEDEAMEFGMDVDEEVKVAVKIIPRHQRHALPFSEAMGIRTGATGTPGGIMGPGGAGVGASTPFGGADVQRSLSLRRDHGASPLGSSPLASPGPVNPHVHRSFSLSQPRSPFAAAGEHLRQQQQQQQQPNSSLRPSAAGANAAPTPPPAGPSSHLAASQLDRNRSVSSPTSRGSLGAGHRPGPLSRGISLAAIQQSPLPTPSAEGSHGAGADAAANLLGTSAPERDAGGFFAMARTASPPGDGDAMSRDDEANAAATSNVHHDGRQQPQQSDGKIDHDLDWAEPEDLLDLLLQREISLWRQLSNLTPIPHGDIPMPRPTRFMGQGGHPYIVALLGTHRSDEFDYIFMPLAEGGTLLDYLNDPKARSRSASRSRSRSRSRSGSPSRSASPPASRDGGRSASRGRGRIAKPRPRASIPFAGSLSPPPAAAVAEKKSLSLRHAGEIFLQVVDGLRWMHEDAGVVHRDLKLENVVGCWSVVSDEELAMAAGARAGAGADDEAMDGAGRTMRGRSRSRLRGSRSGGGGADREATRKFSSRKRRVWKLADFGLAELMPPSCAPHPAVQGVQPLAALARAGSLHHRPEEGRGGQQQQQHHHLGSSVGPGTAPALPTPSGLSQSAFLPVRGQNVHQPSPTAVSVQQQTASPLSALLHPVGSLPYSSPEALRSSVPIVHPSGDLWALGCVLYALVSGRLPIWDEWELRMRVKLVKGEWEVPEELDPSRARNEEDRVEREMVIEVLKGCLEKEVGRRWSIRQVFDSKWIGLVRQRERDVRAGRRPFTGALSWEVEPVPQPLRRSSRTRSHVGAPPNLGLFLDVQSGGSSRGSPARSSNLGLGASPSPTSPNSERTYSRGRPTTRSSSHSHGYGPPPAPSAGASGHHGDGGSSPGLGGRNSLPPTGGGGVADERGRTLKSGSRSRTRLSTRSTSRSSAYAHQYGASGSELGEQERKERGRSERRRRWDEAGSSSGRRSVSRTSTGTSTSATSGLLEEWDVAGIGSGGSGSGLAGESTPAEQDEDLLLADGTKVQGTADVRAQQIGGRQTRSVSRRRPSAHGRDDSGGRSGSAAAHHLETVGEPY